MKFKRINLFFFLFVFFSLMKMGFSLKTQDLLQLKSAFDMKYEETLRELSEKNNDDTLKIIGNKSFLSIFL